MIFKNFKDHPINAKIEKQIFSKIEITPVTIDEVGQLRTNIETPNIEVWFLITGITISWGNDEYIYTNGIVYNGAQWGLIVCDFYTDLETDEILVRNRATIIYNCDLSENHREILNKLISREITTWKPKP